MSSDLTSDCQSALVRLFKPKVIILSFHGAIVPTDWEDCSIEPYVRKNLHKFLEEQWSKSDVLDLISKLKDQSFDEHFIFETEAPLINEFDFNFNNWRNVIDSVNGFVLWQMDKLKISNDVLSLLKLCWVEGFHNKQIKTIIFEDVKPTLDLWKSMDIKLGIFTQMDATICKLILSSTTVGDLSEYFDHYLELNFIGNNNAFYSRVAERFNVSKKDILLISDYGQDIKMASENELQAVLIIRSGNRKTRSYYLTRFPSTTHLEYIKFI